MEEITKLQNTLADEEVRTMTASDGRTDDGAVMCPKFSEKALMRGMNSVVTREVDCIELKGMSEFTLGLYQLDADCEGAADDADGEGEVYSDCEDWMEMIGRLFPADEEAGPILAACCWQAAHSGETVTAAVGGYEPDDEQVVLVKGIACVVFQGRGEAMTLYEPVAYNMLGCLGKEPWVLAFEVRASLGCLGFAVTLRDVTDRYYDLPADE